MTTFSETDLYGPIKAYLEKRGYEVKGEVGHCDVVAVRDGEEPLIVEMKTAFSLPLLLQGVARLSLSDTVYLACPKPTKGNGRSLWSRHHRDIIKLCRRLGVGLMTVKLAAPSRRTAGKAATRRPAKSAGRSGRVEVLLDPQPYAPRKNGAKRGRLLTEFERRNGDPNSGGSTRRPIMTAYRQEALRILGHIEANGPSRPAVIAEAVDACRAGPILQRNVYGWFARIERGVYELTPDGQAACVTWRDAIEAAGPASNSG